MSAPNEMPGPHQATERESVDSPAPERLDSPAPERLDSPAPEPTDPSTPSSPASRMPDYKGEPLDGERGPGLGCFWIQIALLTFFLIFTPLTVTWGWDPFISAALLIFTLVLLLFSGQTIIFLLRLVAADRRTRRAPLDPAAKPTVGQMEEADAVAATEAPPAEVSAVEDRSAVEDTTDDQLKADSTDG